MSRQKATASGVSGQVAALTSGRLIEGPAQARKGLRRTREKAQTTSRIPSHRLPNSVAQAIPTPQLRRNHTSTLPPAADEENRPGAARTLSRDRACLGHHFWL